MARPVFFFGPTWEDRRFKKDLARFPADRREGLLEEIANLVRALSRCNHPATDPLLAPFRPSAYHLPGLKGRMPIYEYRLKKLTRVLAGWYHDGEAVLLIAATVSHDHERMQRLVGGQSTEIADWEPEPEG